MNMTQKFAASFVAVAAVSAVLFTNVKADSVIEVQPTAVPQAVIAVAPLNSPETPAAQLADMQYAN